VQLPNGAFARATGNSTPPEKANSNASSSGLSGGKIAAIGASLGAILLIAILAGVYVFLRRQRRKHTLMEDAPHPGKTELDATQQYHGEEVSAAPVQMKYGHIELQTQEPPQELEGDGGVAGSRSLVELPGENANLWKLTETMTAS
jgi:hypothetical protein